LRMQALPKMLTGVALFGIVLTIALLFAAMPSKNPADADLSSAMETTKPATLVMLGLASLFFLYVGTEVSFSFWAATYAKRLGTGVAEMSTVAPMFFFTGLMSGRGLTPVALNHIRESRLVLGSLCAVVLGGTLLVWTSQQSVAFASLLLAGLGCACL